jgi:hypothetical protein
MTTAAAPMPSWALGKTPGKRVRSIPFGKEGGRYLAGSGVASLVLQAWRIRSGQPNATNLRNATAASATIARSGTNLGIVNNRATAVGSARCRHGRHLDFNIRCMTNILVVVEIPPKLGQLCMDTDARPRAHQQINLVSETSQTNTSAGQHRLTALTA